MTDNNEQWTLMNCCASFAHNHNEL